MVTLRVMVEVNEEEVEDYGGRGSKEQVEDDGGRGG